MRVGILTSGGDAPGMNNAIRAIVRSCFFHNYTPIGINDGYKGLLNEDLKELTKRDVSDILDKGGSILGCGRLDSFKEESVRKQAVEILRKNNIDVLIAIGGDGTYKGANGLALLNFPVIAIPGTIDNDINSTEYTIGFDTTLNTIVDCVDKIRDTSWSHRRCCVVEVMGRYNPDLAVRAGICCGAECVIDNATDWNDEKILEVVHNAKKLNKRSCIIIVAEYTIPVTHIEELLNNDGSYLTRSIVLGYIQRGGHPSGFDRVLASRLGDYAVDLIANHTYNVAVGINGEDLYTTPLDIAVKLPRKRPTQLIEQAKHLI